MCILKFAFTCSRVHGLEVSCANCSLMSLTVKPDGTVRLTLENITHLHNADVGFQTNHIQSPVTKLHLQVKFTLCLYSLIHSTINKFVELLHFSEA